MKLTGVIDRVLDHAICIRKEDAPRDILPVIHLCSSYLLIEASPSSACQCHVEWRVFPERAGSRPVC